MKKLLLLLALSAPLFCNAQYIVTYAGNGSATDTGNGGNAKNAGIESAYGMAFDQYHNLYVLEGSRIRKIGTNGSIADVAPVTVTAPLHQAPILVDKAGNVFYSNSSGNIYKVAYGTTASTLYAPAVMPMSFCMDTAGNLYYSDYSTCRINKVTPDGVTTRYAGTGLCSGAVGDDTIATAATLNRPRGIFLRPNGDMYVAEYGSNRVRKIMPGGWGIVTVAGSGSAAYSGDGGAAITAGVPNVTDVAVDAGGSVYILETGVIRKINGDGVIYKIAGGYNVADYAADGAASGAARFDDPTAIEFGPCDNLFIADNGNHRIREIVYATSCTTVGIADIINSEDLTLYPNPAQGQLTIAAPAAITHISITNTLGQVIYASQPSTKEVTVNIAALPAGVYFVRVNEGVVRRFVKG
ncbi:MAG: T9SS type A sorting domain-containing protein [Bacteroidota bacterium]